MASVIHTRSVASCLWRFQINNHIGTIMNDFSAHSMPIQGGMRYIGTMHFSAINYETSKNAYNQLHSRRSLHTGEILKSRIKWRYTHKPFFHTKKTAKAEEAPLTASNRAFLETVLRDTYNDQQLRERYAYVAPPKEKVQEKKINEEQKRSSPLKAELEPWPRGKWEECGVKTTRVGIIGRKIGVVPMWLKDGKPVLATMLHIEDNHVIRYISPEEFAKTVVAERRIRPYIMKPTASISRESLVVGALSTDPSKFTKDYCGLFAGSGVMPKKKLVRFPGL